MLFFRLLEISVIHPAKCKLPSIREICMCMLVYAYENEVLKKYYVLKYHHIPDHISHLVKSLYSGFHTSVLTSDFHTSFILIRHGVLQGDFLSPLLFNLCCNTFIQHIKAPNYRQFYFLLDYCKNVNPVHWFQFADDAAGISGQESENQHLLNHFTLWCKWSQMVIPVDKCVTFGIEKSATKSIQYLPKLLVNSEVVPCARLGDSFRYLGRYFDFDMSNIVHKQELSQMVGDIMYKIDLLPLHPRNKCQLYRLDLPILGTLRNVFLPRSKCGLSMQPPSIKHAQCHNEEAEFRSNFTLQVSLVYVFNSTSSFAYLRSRKTSMLCGPMCFSPSKSKPLVHNQN